MCVAEAEVVWTQLGVGCELFIYLLFLVWYKQQGPYVERQTVERHSHLFNENYTNELAV